MFFTSFLTQQLLYSKNYKKSLPRPEKETIGQGHLFSLRHYPKFYGDKNTIIGKFDKRSYLTNNLSGLRDALYKHGIYLDATLFQFWGFNSTGGEKHGFFRYNGKAEYWLMFDIGKIGLWPRGAFLFHAESSWTAKDSINQDVGSLLDANCESRIPVPNTLKTTLSEAVLLQFFGENFRIRVGKLDATGPLDGTNFANNARFQFIYTGLVNNPIIFNFTSYTSLALLPIWRINKTNKLLFFIADAEGKADESGFDTAFNGNTNYVLQYNFYQPFKKDLPGTYRFMYAYSKKPIKKYNIDDRVLINSNVGLSNCITTTVIDEALTITKKCNNYAFLINFDQYVWKSDKNHLIEHRHFQPPVGVLLFGRLGWEPKDRNVIDLFFSIGVGSYGVIKKRYYDQWGIGYAATHISCRLRNKLKKIGIYLHDFEHAVEAFYNAEITPALHFTVNAQVIRPPLKSRGTAFLINTRLQADF